MEENTQALIDTRLSVTKVIIILNIAVFLFMMITGDPSNAEYMADHGAVWAPYIVDNGEYYRLFTAVFEHFDVSHIFNNLLLLFFLGDILERTLGRVMYTIVYVLSGIAGNVLSVYMELLTADYSVSAGASGAIFGVVGGVLFEVIYHRGHFRGISTGRMVFFVLLSLYVGVASSGVNNSAHAGGLVCGFLLTAVFQLLIDAKKRNNAI